VKNSKALQTLYKQLGNYWNDAKNKCDFSLVLKVCMRRTMFATHTL